MLSEFQPPEHDEPEKDDDDRMYGVLSDLASLDTHDVNLRDNPKAYEILDRLMRHAYAEGRKDQAEACASPLPAATVQRIWDKIQALDLDHVAFAWHVQRACAQAG